MNEKIERKEEKEIRIEKRQKKILVKPLKKPDIYEEDVQKQRISKKSKKT